MALFHYLKIRGALAITNSSNGLPGTDAAGAPVPYSAQLAGHGLTSQLLTEKKLDLFSAMDLRTKLTGAEGSLVTLTDEEHSLLCEIIKVNGGPSLGPFADHVNASPEVVAIYAQSWMRRLNYLR